MVQISRYKLDDQLLDRLFDLFFEIVGKHDNQEKFNQVINDLLSPVERIMIAKRIAIMYLLLKRIDHRNICRVLKVSTATVAKFNLLLEKETGIKQTFVPILQIDTIKNFFDDFFNSIFEPGVVGVNWKSAWRRKIESNKHKTFGI